MDYATCEGTMKQLLDGQKERRVDIANGLEHIRWEM